MARFNAVLTSIRHCSVPCLFGFIELQQECEKRTVKLSQETKQYLWYEMMKKLGHSQSHKLISKCVGKEVLELKEDYEVESIEDHYRDEQDGQIHYLIKWVGWEHEHNTWEPEHNLKCEELLQEYKNRKRNWHKKRKLPKLEDQRGEKKRRIDVLFQKLMESKILDIISPLDILKCCSPDKKEPHKISLLTQLRTKQLRKKRIPRKLMHQEAVRALQLWQDELNDIVKGYDPAPISVENNVDLEGPPENFFYINERKEGQGVIISKDPLIGCECEDCYEDRKSCCVVASGSVLAYYKSTGRLRVPKGEPIYECNIRCKCGPNCVNRVVQKGRKIKICIFRTPNGRGWGVKTLQNIKKGRFVMEYVGEVITNEEAERRGKDYDAVGRTYLFDLDFHDADAPFAVDAGTYGNAAHFINHSCNPNLEVHVVWINTLDPQLPHICLYAKRDIKMNEELNFDYMGGNLIEESSPLNQVQDSNVQYQPETAVVDRDVLGAHFVQANTLDTTILTKTHSSVGEVKGSINSEAKAFQDIWDKDKGDSLVGLAWRPNGIIFHKMVDLPTLCSQAESVVDKRNENVTVFNEKSIFSMACLCGSSNCRKLLFF